MVFSVFITVLALHAALFSSPWGKDSDLCTNGFEQQAVETNIHSYQVGFEAIISFHQQVITHADGPRSHFYPSSSTYMLNSIKKHGFLQGYLLGCDRLMRENNEEWHYPLYQTKDRHFLKYDPVP